MSLRQESSFSWFQPRLIGVIVISTAAVASTAIVVGGWKATHAEPESPHTIEVSGEAKYHVVPDQLTWTVTVHARSDDREAGLEELQQSVEKARTYLTTHGVKDFEIAIKPPAVERTSNDVQIDDNGETQVPDSSTYDASQQLVITSGDVARALRAYRDAVTAEDLVGADQEEPTCTVAGIDQLEKMLVIQARRDAHHKAEATVEDYGGKLGKLVDGSPGDFDSGTSGVDGCTGGDATATATATYELE